MRCGTGEDSNGNITCCPVEGLNKLSVLCFVVCFNLFEFVK